MIFILYSTFIHYDKLDYQHARIFQNLVYLMIYTDFIRFWLSEKVRYIRVFKYLFTKSKKIKFPSLLRNRFGKVRVDHRQNVKKR